MFKTKAARIFNRESNRLTIFDSEFICFAALFKSFTKVNLALINISDWEIAMNWHEQAHPREDVTGTRDKTC